MMACGTDLCKDAEFYTDHGMCVNPNGYEVTQEQIEVATQEVIEWVSTRHPKKFGKKKISDFSHTSLKFVDDVGPVPDHPGLEPMGVTRYSLGPNLKYEYRIKSEYWPDACTQRWRIFSHELLHVILVEHDNDKTHRNNWFMSSDKSQEINNKAYEIEIARNIYQFNCN